MTFFFCCCYCSFRIHKKNFEIVDFCNFNFRNNKTPALFCWIYLLKNHISYVYLKNHRVENWKWREIIQNSLKLYIHSFCSAQMLLYRFVSIPWNPRTKILLSNPFSAFSVPFFPGIASLYQGYLFFSAPDVVYHFEKFFFFLNKRIN